MLNLGDFCLHNLEKFGVQMDTARRSLGFALLLLFFVALNFDMRVLDCGAGCEDDGRGAECTERVFDENTK